MGGVPAFICILGTIHIVQGQVGYIYNKPNEPINEGTVATLPVPAGFQPATTNSPQEVFVELGRAENPVDGFPGAHLPGQTLGGYNSEKTPSFPGGLQEDSRHGGSQEPLKSPGYPAEHSLSQTTSSGFSGQPVPTQSEQSRLQGYDETVDSLNPPGTKTQGVQYFTQHTTLSGSREDTNRFNENQIQNTYSSGHDGIQNNGLLTSVQTGSAESGLLSTGQYGTTIPDFTTGSAGASFPSSQQEGLSHTPFSTGPIHVHDTGNLELSYGGGGDSDDGSYEGGDYSAIPGEPGVDYPIFSDIPQTSFKCEEQQWPGYYADVQARCQLFHICTNNTSYDFLCPNGTVFSQEYFVCVWWNQFDCNNAPNFFYLNEKIYDYTIMGSQLTEGNFPGFPGVSSQVFQGTNANLGGSLESTAVPQQPPTSFHPSVGPKGPDSPLGRPIAPSIPLFGQNAPLGQPNGPSGPTASFGQSFQPSADLHGPTGPAGPSDSSAVPQGPSTGPSGLQSAAFGSTASYPGSNGSFEPSAVSRRPTTASYPSTGPYSQNGQFGQPSGPVEPTGSFDPNASNGLLGPVPNESSSEPRAPIATFGSTRAPQGQGGLFESSAVPQKPSAPLQPSTDPYSYNAPIEQSNGSVGPDASFGPSTSFQPSPGPQGPTGSIGPTDSFRSTQGSQRPSGSFESHAVPQEPSTSFHPSTRPNGNNAPLGESYGPARPFGPSGSHDTFSGDQGPISPFGSTEISHGPGGPTPSIPRANGSFESSAAPQKPSTPLQPSPGPYSYNAPVGQSNGPLGPEASFGPSTSFQHSAGPQGSTGPIGPTDSFRSTQGSQRPSGSFESHAVPQEPSTSFHHLSGPNDINVPLVQSHGPARPFVLAELHDSSRGAQGLTSPFGSTETPHSPGSPTSSIPKLDGSLESSAPFQPSTGPHSYNALLGQSNGPVGPDASFGPNAPPLQLNGPFGPSVPHESSSGAEGPSSPFGLTEVSHGPGVSGLFESSAIPQKPSPPFQTYIGPYSYNAPLGQSIEPVRPASLQPSNEPSVGPQRPTTSFQSFTGPTGQNAFLGKSNGPSGLSTSFQPPAGPQGPTGPQSHSESFGPTQIPQGPSGSFESHAVPQEPSTSFQPSTGPQTTSAFTPSTGSVESQVPTLPGPSRPQGAFLPEKPTTSTGYTHLSSLDTQRPGEQNFIPQEQGPHGGFERPNDSGVQPGSLQNGTSGPKLDNGYLPPYRHGS